MKKLKLFIALIGLALLFGSCVTSVHPIYTNDTLEYDEGLLGDWITDDSILLSFEKTFKKDKPFYEKQTPTQPSKTYHVTYYDKVPAEFNVHLVKLDKYFYLDFYLNKIELNNELAESTLFPVHTFTKMERRNDTLILRGFDARFIKNLLEQRKIRIKHEFSNDNMLLTAPTEELQKFIIKYADDPELFDNEPSILIRQK